GAVGDIDGVQALDIVDRGADSLLGLDGDVQGGGIAVDDRRAGDANLRTDITRAGIAIGHGRDGAGGPERAEIGVVRIGGVEKSALPEDLTAERAGIDGVESV